MLQALEDLLATQHPLRACEHSESELMQMFETEARRAYGAVELEAHQRLGIRTGPQIVNQWNALHLSHTFLFTLPYEIGRPDFPMKLRDCRVEDRDQNVPVSPMLLPEQHSEGCWPTVWEGVSATTRTWFQHFAVSLLGGKLCVPVPCAS